MGVITKHVFAVLLMCGCTSMPDVKVSGIDGLMTTENVLSQSKVISVCMEKLGIPRAFTLLVMPLACANIILEEWTCTIFYALATADVTLEHERLHCKGYWHDDGLRTYRDEWRSNSERDL